MSRFIKRFAFTLVAVFTITSLASAQAPATAPPAEPARVVPKIIATVNGEDISYQKLANTCVADYGAEVLERVVSRFILEQACREANVEVTEADMETEIKSAAARLGVSADQYLKMIESERGIMPVVFLRDVIWPTVAARKLANPKDIQATDDDIRREYESQYGPAVKVRLLAMNSKEDILKIRQELAKDVTKFPEMAQKHSVDPNSAALGGVVPEVRRHLNPPEVEEIIFSLKPGELSQPIPVGETGQYMLLLCEEHLPQDPAITLESVKGELARNISQFKTKNVGTRLLQEKFAKSQVEIFYGDQTKSNQRPGVAAIVNGQLISTGVLATECVALYGQRALEGLINRAIIEQAIKKQKIQITEVDLNKKIAEMALESIPPKGDGSPDVEQYLQRVAHQHSTTIERFRKEVVWMLVALERLVADKVVVTQEDLQRGYVANFGKKVRCRAIVLRDQRSAQRVWALARENATEDNFMELARKFSIDAASGALGGEVPPIQQYGGMPELEKVAFSLDEGELSGVIQVADKFIILLCIGHTEPIGVTFDDVKDNILKDLTYKKTELAIAEEFQNLMDAATIDNYLTGNSKSPVQAKPADAVQPK